MFDWKSFIGFCQEHLGHSPTRILDKTGDSGNMELPGTILKCLSMDNKYDPASEYLYKHISMGFIIKLDTELLLDIQVYANLNVFTKKGRKDFVTILSGNLEQWHKSIIICCQPNKSQDLRQVFNKCLAYFDQAGFKDVWMNNPRIQMDDNTFYLGL